MPGENINIMSDQELKEWMATIAVKHAEIADKHAELAEFQREADLRLQETERLLREQSQETERLLLEGAKKTDRQLQELGRQIGGLGDKFGSFTEGMAFPSMKKILKQRFRMEFVAPSVERRRLNGRTMELDVLAYSNSGRNEVYIVEVKSHLREEAIGQMKKILRDFRDFFPEHADKKVFGILAVVHAPGKTGEKVVGEGIYLARIHDGQFELQIPGDFQPRSF